MAGWRETEESHEAAPSDAAQAQRDLLGRKNLGYRTNRRDGWRRPERARTSGADLGNIEAIDCREICSQRAAGDSSAARSDTFICALARRTSVSLRSKVAWPRQSSATGINSAASFALVAA